MKFLPKSLLGRTALFVIALVILTQLATTLVVQQFYTKPLQQRLIDDRINHIKSMIDTLNMLDDQQRVAYIAYIKQNEHANIYSEKDISPPPEAEPPSLERLIAMEERLKKEVSSDIKIYVSDTMTIPKVWTYLVTTQGNYWFVTERLPFDADFPAHWTFALMCFIALSLVALYFGVRHLIRPINRLTQAAQAIAKGALPERVSEKRGPEEIRTLSRVFNEMQHSLEEIDSNRAVMLAGVSHDLKTPLSRLRLAIELSHGEDDHSTELMIQDLEEIDDTLKQFLDFARIQNEHWLTKSNLNVIVDKVAHYFAARDYPISIQLNSRTDIQLNPKSIERVLINLVENARRYGKPPISIVTSEDTHWLHVAVIDHGEGFTEEEALHLLKPFTRKEHSRSGMPGTGLGLAIVDKVIRLHQGVLRFNRTPHSYFEVKISLPIKHSPYPQT